MTCDEKNKKNCCKKIQEQAVQDHLVCTCMAVMRSEIEQAIDQGFTTFEALSEQLGVGTGCSSCVQEVNQILHSKLQSGCCKS